MNPVFPFGHAMDERWLMSEDAVRRIGEEAAATRHRSRGHDYSLEAFGLTREAIYEPLREVFEAYGFEP